MDNTVTPQMLLDADGVLQEGASELGIILSEEQRAKFTKLIELLYDWNQRVNLTRIAPADAIILHVLDSLLIAAVESPAPGSYILDVGCGAGFPGLCIAIAWPEVSVTLIDGTRKKIDFVNHAIETLGIQNARGVHARAEAWALEDSHRKAYDIVTARAVSEIGLLAKLFAPLLRKGGVGVAYKGPELAQELKKAKSDLQRFRCSVKTKSVVLPGTDLQREMARLDYL